MINEVKFVTIKACLHIFGDMKAPELALKF